MSDRTEVRGRTAEVTFGPLKRALREHRYPVTDAELIEQYGGFELEFGEGSEPLEVVLQRCEQSTFTEPWEVRDAIVEGLDGEAVVRPDTEEDAESDADPVGDWSRLSG